MQSILSHPWVVVFLLGLWLAIGDCAAIVTGTEQGRKLGAVSWAFLVLLPLLAGLWVAFWPAVGAALLATFLGAVSYKQRQAGAQAY
jgi:uncharacterized membrane protein HdeD (DUF308 family)